MGHCRTTKGTTKEHCIPAYGCGRGADVRQQDYERGRECPFCKGRLMRHGSTPKTDKRRYICKSCKKCVTSGGRARNAAQRQRPESHRGPVLSSEESVNQFLDNTFLGVKEELALTFARRISGRTAAELLGPCYAAVDEGMRAGILDEEMLFTRARKAVVSMWKETRSHIQSLDEIKSRHGGEAVAASQRGEEQGG